MSTAQRTSSRRSRSDDHPPSPRLAACAVDALADRKAGNITVLDLRSLEGVADFFVIGTGESDRQIRAIANVTRDQVEEMTGERPWHIEGMEHLQWVLLDYVDVVIHVFSREKRAYYDLERLWGDADIEEVPADAGAASVRLLQKALTARRGEE